jgi:UDP-sugar pyrophosphorylase
MSSSSSLPEDVTASIPDKEQLKLLRELVTVGGQSHLLHAFSKSKDKEKLQELAAQLFKLNKGYALGGLLGYIEKAKTLLEDSKSGVNPLDGWKPSVPKGEKFDLGTEKYDSTEAQGMKFLGKVGFILVAGGLGERLGYNGAKVNDV